MSSRGQEWSDKAQLATQKANQAAWRSAAIKEVSRGIAHLVAAYEGNEQALALIGEIIDAYKKFGGSERCSKLWEIEQEQRAIAARFTALIAEGAHNES